MNTNETRVPRRCSRYCAQRAAAHLAPSCVDPEQLKQLICKEGNSLSRAAHLIGVCTNTVSIAAVRFGIAIDARPKKIDQALKKQFFLALERNLPLEEVSAETGVSLSTIYRLLRMHPQQAQAYKLRLLEQERLTKRRRFTEQVATMPMTTCTDYYWLRCNDSEWIATFSNSLARLSTINSSRRPS
jgi:hypothetical protein